MGEIREIKEKLGWRQAIEEGKFYDHLGSDRWYYFIYGQLKSASEAGAEKNEVASLACGKAIYGDVVVLRSGPLGGEYPEDFAVGSLCKTVEFYRTHSSRRVFAEREKSRFMRSVGMGSMGVPSMHIGLVRDRIIQLKKS